MKGLLLFSPRPRRDRVPILPMDPAEQAVLDELRARRTAPTTRQFPPQEVDARSLPPLPAGPVAGGDQRVFCGWADLLLAPLWLVMVLLLLIGLGVAGGLPPHDPEDRG